MTRAELKYVWLSTNTVGNLYHHECGEDEIKAWGGDAQPQSYLIYSHPSPELQFWKWAPEVFLNRQFFFNGKRSVRTLCMESGVAVVLSASHLSWFANSLPGLLWPIRRWGSKAVRSPSVWVQLAQSDLSILNFIQEPLPHAAEDTRISCWAFKVLLVLHLVRGNI